MLDIVAFLRDRLADDEQVADVAGLPIFTGQGDDSALYVLNDDYRHNTVVIPTARVLAEVQAKRTILELHTPEPAGVLPHPSYRPQPSDPENMLGCAICHEWDGIYVGAWPCPTVRLLAQPWADHPDFDPEWQVTA